jgi:biphenyl 2,3-dioxygenase beta subunit
MLLNAEVHYQIEQFLYAEAALLDEHRYSEWLELFTDDCQYWMPVRQTRLAREVDQEFTRRGEIAYFDDDKQGLRLRVKKLESPLAWSESPPPRTRHMYSNIRTTAAEGGEISVSSSFTFYRCAFDNDVDWFVGRREDVLRRVEGGFKIAKRSIFLDQTVIVAKNMNHFF